MSQKLDNELKGLKFEKKINGLNFKLKHRKAQRSIYLGDLVTCMGEWEISASISSIVGRYDVQYTQTGLAGWAVYHVKGVICERDVYSILERSIAYVFQNNS